MSINHTSFPKRVSIILTAIILTTFITTDLIAQSRINSPYSMFGPGEITGNQYFRNLGMGGISQGFRTNTSVNYLNPASYSALDTLSFIFDGTVFSHLYQQKQGDLEQTSLYTNLGSLNLAFPLNRRWGIAAGVLPWSQVGYSISSVQQDDINGQIDFLYEGSGGINQVYAGTAYRIYKGFSLGFNASYLFGRMEDRSISSSDSVGFYRTTWSFSDEIGGFLYTLGAQWEIKLNENQKLTLGASYTNPTQLNVAQNRYIIRTISVASTIDTLQASPDNKGTMNIPTNLAGGVFFDLNPQIGIGLDYQAQNWSEYTSFENNPGLNDAYQLRFGAIYKPRMATYSGFLSRLEYRLGARYGQSMLHIPDNSGLPQTFNEIGISFGLSVPVRRSLSALNFGFEYSTRTSESNTLIDENYFRFNIGINVYERWFLRRKFF